MAAALLNHAIMSAQPQAGTRVSPMASASSNTTNDASSTASTSAGITANDFLTLLVTEMKNQDPTANTDPNEYINQLVNVNSLQQLISINQTLTGASSPSNASTAVTTQEAQTAPASTAAPNAKVGVDAKSQLGTVPVADTDPAAAGQSTMHAFLSKLSHGNLSAPGANPAALRLAHALDGGSPAPTAKK
jgi:flagellar basal-body rod modification protein FlgD